MDARAWTLQDVVVFEGPVHRDDRGFFVRTMEQQLLRDVGIDPGSFVQESQSRSRHGVLRGLHGRTALSEGKLVRCARGAVFEVVLDLRPWSNTYLRWDSLILDDVEHRHLWVPPGMVHGFEVLSDAADICYRMDALHDPTLDLAVAWDDAELAIPWPLPAPTVSDRDRAARALADVRPHLEEWFGAHAPVT